LVKVCAEADSSRSQNKRQTAVSPQKNIVHVGKTQLQCSWVHLKNIGSEKLKNKPKNLYQLQNID
jgi:hypothetical protein